jgi:hypothetical protein
MVNDVCCQNSHVEEKKLGKAFNKNLLGDYLPYSRPPPFLSSLYVDVEEAELRRLIFVSEFGVKK